MSAYSDYEEIYKSNKKNACSELAPCLKSECPLCQRRYRFRREEKKDVDSDKKDNTLTFIIIIIGVLIIAYLIFRLSTPQQLSFNPYIPQYIHSPMQQFYQQPPQQQPYIYYSPQHESPSQPIIIIQSPTPPSK